MLVASATVAAATVLIGLEPPACADEKARTASPKPPAAPVAKADRPSESPAHPTMPADVATFGVISLLRADDDRAVPRPEVAMERVHEKEKPLAISIWAESIDDAASGAGLRLSSTGISGGKARVGERATVATVGKGAVDFDLSAFDDDRGGLGDRRFAQRVTGPDGHLPSELIQRVVRDNFGRFETCYRGGLRRNPTLRGRVVVTFVIDRRGNVALARDSGSDLPDADVTGCVVRAFDTLVFAESKDSSVTIVYPLVFKP